MTKKIVKTRDSKIVTVMDDPDDSYDSVEVPAQAPRSEGRRDPAPEPVEVVKLGTNNGRGRLGGVSRLGRPEAILTRAEHDVRVCWRRQIVLYRGVGKDAGKLFAAPLSEVTSIQLGDA